MIMDPTYFLRQLDIAAPSQFKDKPVTVIGAGERLRIASKYPSKMR